MDKPEQPGHARQPKRRFNAILRLSGDTIDDLVQALWDAREYLDNGGRGPILSGGPTGSFSLALADNNGGKA